jgi:hypothetical protein
MYEFVYNFANDFKHDLNSNRIGIQFFDGHLLQCPLNTFHFKKIKKILRDIIESKSYIKSYAKSHE